MITTPDATRLTPEQYLQLEADRPLKHEYRNGKTYAMAGTTDSHNLIAGNLYNLIRSRLRGSLCRVYFANVKARLDDCNCLQLGFVNYTQPTFYSWVSWTPPNLRLLHPTYVL